MRVMLGVCCSAKLLLQEVLPQGLCIRDKLLTRLRPLKN